MKQTKKAIKTPLPQTSDSPSIRKPVLIGFLILLIFISGFFIWSISTTLDSGAIAKGKITVDTNRKTIQHLEGGIVKKIYVREGALVKKGDPLLKLDETQSKVKLSLLQSQAAILQSLTVRLLAEIKNKPSLVFPKELTLKASKNPNITEILNGQKSLFKARQDSRKSTILILNERIKQLKSQIDSLHSQVDSSDKQLGFVREELKAVIELRKKNYIDKPRLLRLQREEAKLVGERDKSKALIAQQYQKIGETKIQLLNYEENQRKEILEELRESQSKLVDIIDRLKSAQDIFQRTLVVAPQAGTVVGTEMHTIGGVVRPGDKLMDLVPSQDKLIVEGHISPLDVDVVRPGLLAKVRLSSYKQRHVPALLGTVEQISADSFENKQTGELYYKARIIIDKGQLKKLKNITLYPGMPAEVMIVSDKRTPFDYFFSPLWQSFNRAFHEQ